MKEEYENNNNNDKKSKNKYSNRYITPNGDDNNDQQNDRNGFIDYYSDVREITKKEENKKEKEKEQENQKNKNNSKNEQIKEEFDFANIDNETLTESLKNILLDKEFSAPVLVKKENKLISDYHYATFQNAYGENSCFVNVILHLLFKINEIFEYLTSMYNIDQSNIETKNRESKNNNNQNEENENNKLLVLLGDILCQYEGVDSENDEENKKKFKQITVLKTLKMRKVLETISDCKFPLNTIADPVEFLTFILDLLNEYLKESLHKIFYLELIDEFYCQSKNNCQITIKNKYDKDNFIYHIYIDEIIKYIEQENLKVKNYKNKLFEYSYKLFLSENKKKCEKCKVEMGHNLVCMNYPEHLLINCVWKESNPIVDDVISFFFLISLKDDLNNLFVCYNQTDTKKKYNYYLSGFILYSFTLSHYIICLYNSQNNVFVLYDDETVKEYKNLYDLIIDITVNTLRQSGKAFFYPVMLIFNKDSLFDNKFIKFNTLLDSDYTNIIQQCIESIQEYQDNMREEEEKLFNYQDLIAKQREIENSFKRRRKYKNNYNEREKEKERENEIETPENDINNKEIKQNDNKDKDINESNNNKKEKVKEDKNKYEKNEMNDSDINNRRKKGIDIKTKYEEEEEKKEIKGNKNKIYEKKLNEEEYNDNDNEIYKDNNNNNKYDKYEKTPDGKVKYDRRTNNNEKEKERERRREREKEKEREKSNYYSKNMNDEENQNLNKTKEDFNDIKSGLEIRNKNKLSEIFRDLKKVNTKDNDNYNINEDLSNRKKKNINKNNYDENEDNETPYNKPNENYNDNTKNRNIKNSSIYLSTGNKRNYNFEDKRNRYVYRSQRANLNEKSDKNEINKENKENKEHIYEKRNVQNENTYMTGRPKFRINTFLSNNKDSNNNNDKKESNIKTENKEIKDSTVYMRRKRPNFNNNAINWNSSLNSNKYRKTDEKIQENKNEINDDNDLENIKIRNDKDNGEDDDKIIKRKNNEIKTPKKERFHYRIFQNKEDNNNSKDEGNNKKTYNKTEKRDNNYSSKFNGSKYLYSKNEEDYRRDNIDSNSRNDQDDSNEENNDNKIIRKKVYTRQNREWIINNLFI